MLPRIIFVALFLASVVSARYRGSSAFIVDDSPNDYDYDTPSTTTGAPVVETTTETVEVVEVQKDTAEAPVEQGQKVALQPTRKGAIADGHDPMEVVEAAFDVLNTPVNRMVGSNPLRRLLRLVAPTQEDFMAGIKMTQDFQKANGVKEIPSVTALPPVVNHIFGFHQSEEELFRKTTTVAPLFPMATYDHEAILKYLNKIGKKNA